MNPQNKFQGFFQGQTPPPVRPVIEQVVESVMHIIVQRPDWFKTPDLRLLIAKTASGLGAQVAEERKNGKQIDLHVGYAAFMLMVTEVLDLTFDEHATDEEREVQGSDE